MSVKIMGMVWDLKVRRDEKLVLLAYADHADHDGGSIYPSVALIARKTGYSERSIQSITRRLEGHGYLLADGKGVHGTNRWRIPISGGSICRGAKPAPVQNEEPGGAENAPAGVRAAAPDSSFNRQEPSTTTAGRSEHFVLYEQEIGPLTPLIAEEIGGYAADPRCPPGWIGEAVCEAARQNKRNWAYVRAILNRWMAEGKQARVKLPAGTKYPRRGRGELLERLAKA